MKSKTWALRCTSAVALFAPTMVFAQANSAGGTEPVATATAASPAATETGLADIVVTAQKRDSTLQHTPAAVQVIGAAALVDHGVTDIVRLQTQVTGLIIQPSRQSVYMFSRGLGQADAQYQTSPAIEMQEDGLTLPRSGQQFALFDIGNIQVLKGPQGILYGRYGIGGAVLVNSKRPTYGHIGGEASFELGNYGLMHGFGALNLPVSDNAGFRAAVDYQFHRGYVTNGEDDLDQIAGRLSFQTDLNDRLSIFLSATGADRKGHGFAQINFPRPSEAGQDPYVVLPVPSSGVVGFANFSANHNRGFLREKSYLLNGEINYKLTDDVKLSYVAGYFDHKGQQDNAFTNKTGPYFINYASTYYVEDSWDLQNEVRGTYQRGGMTIVIGALQHRFEAQDNVVQVAYRAGPFINGPHSPTESNYAVFGDVTVPITSKLRLEAGTRQSWDIKHDTGFLSNEAVDINGSNFKNFKNLSWKAGVEYDVTDHILTYANVQTGYLPGAYQTATTAVLNSLGLGRRYKSQKVTAYQAGVKSRFFDNRIQLNAEGFYYDYKNFQVTQRVTDPTNPNVFQSPYANIRKSRIYGADIDLNARIIRNGTATVGLSLLNTKIIDSGFTRLAVIQLNGLPRTETGANGFPAIDPSLHGFDLPFSPHVTLNLGYEQLFPLASGGNFTANVSTHHESSKWLDYTHSPVFPGQQPSFWKTDVSLTYHAPSNVWYAGVWGRNLENRATYSSFTPSQLRVGGVLVGAYSNVYVDAPRTYGMRAGINF
jgi:iron complex outermembrane receptor protein